MRDVDLALSRAYATEAKPVARTIPFAHRPHFVIEAGESPPVGDSTTSLTWPETVRTLERTHGERFEALADAVLAARDQRGMKLVVFTSAHRAEGRTTLVLALARALARRPGRTLLVDGDLGGPMLARALGLRPKVGLIEVLEHGTALSDALIEAPDDHLVLLPGVVSANRPREVLASDGWSKLMARLRRDFDLVLIDGGPIFSGPSAASAPRSVDAAVLVHHKSWTSNRVLARARDALDEAGVPLLGLAETFC